MKTHIKKVKKPAAQKNEIKKDVKKEIKKPKTAPKPKRKATEYPYYA